MASVVTEAEVEVEEEEEEEEEEAEESMNQNCRDIDDIRKESSNRWHSRIGY